MSDYNSPHRRRSFLYRITPPKPNNSAATTAQNESPRTNQGDKSPASNQHAIHGHQEKAVADQTPVVSAENLTAEDLPNEATATDAAFCDTSEWASDSDFRRTYKLMVDDHIQALKEINKIHMAVTASLKVRDNSSLDVEEQPEDTTQATPEIAHIGPIEEEASGAISDVEPGTNNATETNDGETTSILQAEDIPQPEIDTAQAKSDADSVATAHDANSRAPSLGETCASGLTHLELLRQPAQIVPPEPLYADRLHPKSLEYDRWTQGFIDSPQFQKLSAYLAKMSLGTAAWRQQFHFIAVLKLICELENEQGCYTHIDGKELPHPVAWFKVSACPVCPLEQDGILSSDNFLLVPDIICKKNSQTPPSAEDLKKEPIRRLYDTITTPGSKITRRNFIRRSIEERGMPHTVDLIRRGMPFINGAPVMDREPPVVELPVLCLLYRECGRHDYLNRYRRGLEYLHQVYADQSGILEATALVCLDALTLGNPGHTVDSLMELAALAHQAAQGDEEYQSSKDELFRRVHSWIYERFQLDIRHAPQKFEKKLYERMFSHPPVHLHW